MLIAKLPQPLRRFDLTIHTIARQPSARTFNDSLSKISPLQSPPSHLSARSVIFFKLLAAATTLTNLTWRATVLDCVLRDES
jgi:hypothetical protein